MKIYSFDLDSTIITTISGKPYSRKFNDWKLLFDNTISKLRSVHEESHFPIVIFTNQSSIRGAKLSAIFRSKIKKIFKIIGVEYQLYFSSNYNRTRKPDIGMFELFLKNNDLEDVTFDLCYVGDAAGREGDFSCSDRKFADNINKTYENVNVEFFTPEQFFKDSDPQPFNWGFQASVASAGITSDTELITNFKDVTTQEAIVVYGPPTSGKTKIMDDINYTTCNNWSECKKALKNGDSIMLKFNSKVVNRLLETEIPVKCIVVEINIDLAFHLGVYKSRINNECYKKKYYYHNYIDTLIKNKNVFNRFNSVLRYPFVLDPELIENEELFLLWS